MNEAADDTTLQITRLFDASPERVFDAWLKREQWQAWIGPEGMNCDVTLLEPHVGGRYRITMRLSESNVVPVAGLFKAIDRPEKLAFTWGREGDPSRTSLITLTFRRDCIQNRTYTAPGGSSHRLQSRRSRQGMEWHAQQTGGFPGSLTYCLCEHFCWNSDRKHGSDC